MENILSISNDDNGNVQVTFNKDEVVKFKEFIKKIFDDAGDKNRNNVGDKNYNNGGKCNCNCNCNCNNQPMGMPMMPPMDMPMNQPIINNPHWETSPIDPIFGNPYSQPVYPIDTMPIMPTPEHIIESGITIDITTKATTEFID